jgi:protein-tyrosine kinase
MNANYETETLQARPNYAEELREALIAQCRLNAEAIERISESMRGSGMSFDEAAVHIGLVTEREAEEAGAWTRATLASREASVVEQALRRQGSNPRQVSTSFAGIGRPSPELAFMHSAQHPYGERIRSLRTELLLLKETDRQAGCFAVLSPCRGEGRSHLAAELAIAFSQLNRRTLLVDADLRNPSQHLLFGIESQWGLAQSLTFGQPSQVFGVQGLPYLSVIPAMPPAPNPSELLSAGGLKQLIRRWRFTYDFIILDTPPMSRYPDALNVASTCHNVMMIGRARFTPYRDMRAALHRLSNTPSRVLGAVIGNF